MAVSKRESARTCSYERGHNAAAAETFAYIVDDSADISALAAAYFEDSLARGLVIVCEIYRENLYFTRSSLDLDTLPRKVVKPLAVYLHSRVHRRKLHYLSRKFGNYSKYILLRNFFLVLGKDSSRNVLRIGDLTETKSRAVAFGVVGHDVAGFCGVSDKDRQNSRSHRVERSSVPEPARLQNSPQLGNCVK